MSRSIYETSLVELLPINLKYDPDIIAASQATDSAFWNLANAINNISIYDNLENLSSELCDYMAVELNADFYDQTLPLANRQALVTDAYPFKFYKGTPWALQQITIDVLGVLPNQIYDYTYNPFIPGETPVGMGQPYSPSDLTSMQANINPVIFEYSLNAFTPGITPVGSAAPFSASEKAYIELYINYSLPYDHQKLETAVQKVKRKSSRVIIYHSGADTSPLNEASKAVITII